MIGAVSVRQLNLYVKSLLEGDPRLSNITVTGEISNFKNHFASGHWYFTLKDGDAAIRCVMFRSYAARVKISVEDGMRVVIHGRISVYERDGQYQLYAEQLTEDGVGDLAAAFEQTKRRLQAEGLFDAQNKRPLPAFPQTVAVVTSETGAAVQDILNISSRRFPLCRILLCGVAVQGVNAVPEMIRTLDRLYALNCCDVILIGRGGGSAEDLSAYNDERLARKIYESPVPTVSAVGHETDFSISDFVADLRAPTPSAAAELIFPNGEQLLKNLQKQRKTMLAVLENRCRVDAARLAAVQSSAVLKHPEEIVLQRMMAVDHLTELLTTAAKDRLRQAETQWHDALNRLDAMSPLKVLTRGYAVAQKDGSTVKSIENIKTGDRLAVRFQDGIADCTVTATQTIKEV
ncbi:MAG: exodeoxyribonuclease VII large subunit [Clostridia bacterium]|nr:exodeoxyribonuclease VII large subunit [Clostridia bacterium]